jgi:sulfur-carrier protein
VALVEFTSHLKTHFPVLPQEPFEIEASSVRELITALEQRAPGIGYYICDELGRLRKHVNIFVDQEMLMDRRNLGDALRAESRVFIAQALSGG